MSGVSGPGAVIPDNKYSYPICRLVVSLMCTGYISPTIYMKNRNLVTLPSQTKRVLQQVPGICQKAQRHNQVASHYGDELFVHCLYLPFTFSVSKIRNGRSTISITMDCYPGLAWVQNLCKIKAVVPPWFWMSTCFNQTLFGRKTMSQWGIPGGAFSRNGSW